MTKNLQLLGLVISLVELGLVQHSIESDGGFSGLTITNDQLTLTTSNGDKGINGLKTSLHRLVDGFTGNDTRGFKIDLTALSGLEGSESIEGVSEGIDATSQKFGSDWDIDNSSSSHNGVTLLDQTIVTENDNTDVVTLQVQGLKYQGQRIFLTRQQYYQNKVISYLPYP